MSVTVEFWQLLTFLVMLLITFVTCIWALAKVLGTQQEKRLDERFEAMEARRKEGQGHWDVQFAAIESAMKADSAHWLSLERNLMALKAELPVSYVRREDYIRNQTIIEAKLDNVVVRIENLRLEGGKK